MSFFKGIGEVFGAVTGVVFGSVGGVLEAAKVLNDGGDWDDAKSKFSETVSETVEGTVEEFGEFSEKYLPTIVKAAGVVIVAVAAAAAATNVNEKANELVHGKEEESKYKSLLGAADSYSKKTGKRFTKAVINKKYL
jgi:hypothetical protein